MHTPSVSSRTYGSVIPLPNEQLLLTAHSLEAAGSLRSPAALFMIAPQQNAGVIRHVRQVRASAVNRGKEGHGA